MSTPRKIVLLGATGSIGESTLAVIRKHPDKLQIVAAAAHSSTDSLLRIAREFSLSEVALTNSDAAKEAQAKAPQSCEIHTNTEALTHLATLPEADLIVCAIVGTAGFDAVLAALKAGKDVALASKEILVMGGAFVMEEVAKSSGRLLPIDSEHNALFQCLQGERPEDIDRLILTASGGPFRTRPLDQMATITPEDALRHPNWNMGPKITVDSATMANKGLELIEARWLFGIPESRIDIVIHPQSIVHSMVQYRDGSIIAQLSPPCMTFAIQHCLLHPGRAEGVRDTLDFAKALQLDFAPPEADRFPCLALARQALKTEGSAPAVFNAANEIAVRAFLDKQIHFTDIAVVIDKTLELTDLSEPANLADIFDSDKQAREHATNVCSRLNHTYSQST